MTAQTVHARRALTECGWEDDVLVTLEGGRIRSLHRRPDAGTEADAVRAAILLPAPANLHSHAFQRAMSGLCERRSEAAGDSFWTWRRFMYRFLERLEPDEIRGRNIPTGIPFVYRLDARLRVLDHRYLADAEELQAGIARAAHRP